MNDGSIVVIFQMKRSFICIEHEGVRIVVGGEEGAKENKEWTKG